MNIETPNNFVQINPDKVPINLEEAVKIIKDGLSEESIEWIKRFSPHLAHFSLGRAIRNEWSLWEKDIPIVQWFKKEYGLDHADDISGIILDCVWMDIKGQPRRDKKIAEENKIYWELLQKAEKEGRAVNVINNKDGTITIELVDNEN